MHLVGSCICHHHPALSGMHCNAFGPGEAFGQSREVTRNNQSINTAGQTIGDEDATLGMLGDGGRPFEVVEDRGPLTNSERFNAQRRQQDQ